MGHSQIEIVAPAKINLALHIVGQRQDGYHLLESLVCFTQVSDIISLRINSDTNTSLKIDGPFSNELTSSPYNLVLKAAEKYFQSTGHSNQVEIILTKNLPIASGIGGGSADAAATLLALAVMNDDHDVANLEYISNQLGADVPMCLHSSTQLVRGIGNECAHIKSFPTLDILLVNPMFEVSTPEIFKKLITKESPPLTPLPTNLDQSDALLNWLKQQRNDLQEPAIAYEPIIQKVLSQIERSGAEISRMSGSGATCFGVFKNAKDCEAAKMQILKDNPNWWVVATKTQEFGKSRTTQKEIEA